MQQSRTFTVQEAAAFMKVSLPCSDSDITKAYRQLIKMHHPDRFMQYDETIRQAAEAYTRDLNEARQVLQQSLKNNFSPASAATTSTTEFPNATRKTTVHTTQTQTAAQSTASKAQSQTNFYQQAAAAQSSTARQAKTTTSYAASTVDYEEPATRAWHQWQQKQQEKAQKQAAVTAQEMNFNWQQYKKQVSPEIWAYAMEEAQNSREFNTNSALAGITWKEPLLTRPEVRAAGYAMAIQAYWKYRYSEAAVRYQQATDAFAQTVPFDDYGKSKACQVGVAFTMGNSLKAWPQEFFAAKPNKPTGGFMGRLHSLFT